MQKLSQSTKAKNPREPTLGMHPSKNINLPKLDKIIVRNGVANYKNIPGYEKKQAEIDVSSLLKIEGKNSQKYDYNKYDESKKVLDRDLKAELRRIYNLKPSPSKQDRQSKPYRNIELPRIN